MFLGDKHRVCQIDNWFKLRTDLVDQSRSFGPARSIFSCPDCEHSAPVAVAPARRDSDKRRHSTTHAVVKISKLSAHPRCAKKNRNEVCSWGPRAGCFSVDLLGSAAELVAETLRDVYFAPDILESCLPLLGQSAGLLLAYEAFKFCLQPASIKWATGMKTFWNKMLHHFTLGESLSVLI